MKYIKKIVLSLFLTFAVFLGTTFIIHAASQVETLTIHYYRYDNNYTNFNVWLWELEPGNLGGIKHDFNNEDVDEHGAFIEINLKEFNYHETTTFGIIVKQGDWGGYAEPGGDRHMALDKMEVIDGGVHAYLVEQDLNIGLSNADLSNNKPDYRPRVLSAFFNEGGTINASLTHPITSYELFEDNISVLSNTVTSDSKSLNITLPNEVDLMKSYKLKVTFESGDVSETDISIQNLYDTDAFNDAFTYTGNLGVIYSESKTSFRLWAPISEKVSLNLYHQGHAKYNNLGIASEELTPVRTVEMNRIENGAWEVSIEEDLINMYYTFSVTNKGITHEVTDPYSYSTGANGTRSLIMDLEKTNPSNWSKDYRPTTITNLTDYTIYELHVRDLTSHSSWNGSEANRGKFLGFTEEGTTYTNRDNVTVTTGLDHIKELGVNAVQLLPIFDFGYVDEIEMANNPSYSNTFNWGYMPYHFNTLEGSYSTNPFDGNVRVNEFKQLVQKLHDNDIRVIMDVVYNHTGASEDSNFHKIIPGYYHRMNETGGFYNGSGTGNETASDRIMVRNFMLDSLKFLATEYNLSGFRFDLMALHDVETMQAIEAMLHEIDPTIAIFGEPWDAGGSPNTYEKADKEGLADIGLVGAFNDTTRDAIKGATFGGNVRDGAWIHGQKVDEHFENVKYGIAGGINHSQVSATKWHLDPQRTINYVTAHDNNTLHDKLRLSGVRSPKLERMQIQANAIIITSQGIPFLHAGVEFMRSKPAEDGGFDENSYESPDSVNQLNWERKASYNDVFEYYKALIQIRKHYPQFRYAKTDDIQTNLKFLDGGSRNTIAYEITHKTLPSIVVIHNNDKVNLASVILPAGKTFRALTGLDEFNLLGLTDFTGNAFALMNTSVILVENLIPDNVGVKNETVKIDKGGSFDPLSNINYSEDHTVYHSGFYNTNVSGTYLISVMVVDSNGNFIPLNYNLVVSGAKFNVKLKGAN